MLIKYSIIIFVNLICYSLIIKIPRLSNNEENKAASKVLLILSVIYVIVDILFYIFMGTSKNPQTFSKMR